MHRTATERGTRIDHLGIAVKSIATARTFYEAVGLAVTHEEEVAHEGVRTAMVPVGESRIELLEPLGDDTPVGKFLAKRGEGLHHVALHVDDISATLEQMKERGVEIASPQIQVGAGGHLYFFVHPRSAGGVLVEICQDPIQDPVADEATHG
ncbi:MAG: methylmalonyl-CoA epimerase [Acidobacteriaceae bacterium]